MEKRAYGGLHGNDQCVGSCFERHARGGLESVGERAAVFCHENRLRPAFGFVGFGHMVDPSCIAGCVVVDDGSRFGRDARPDSIQNRASPSGLVLAEVDFIEVESRCVAVLVQGEKQIRRRHGLQPSGVGPDFGGLGFQVIPVEIESIRVAACSGLQSVGIEGRAQQPVDLVCETSDLEQLAESQGASRFITMDPGGKIDSRPRSRTLPCGHGPGLEFRQGVAGPPPLQSVL